MSSLFEEMWDEIAEKDKKISDLEAKLKESESKVAVGRFWHSAYEGKQLDYDKLNDDYNKQEKLLSEVLANKSKLQFEFDQLKQQLAEERKKVCEQIYQLFTNGRMWSTMKDWWLNNGTCIELKQVLDAVETETPNQEIIKKFSKDREYYALLEQFKKSEN